MGTSAADFADLHAGAGNAQQLAMHEVDGMPLEDQLTGYGVVVAARAAAEWLGGGLAAATVAIEGFGKVGGGAAKFFAREGARVVAISTIRGTLDDPGGIDIDRLLALRSVHGDGAVQEYDTTRSLLPREALPAVPADVLAPGARPDAIHEGNVEMVRARLIVPAANIPYAEGIPERLAARQIVALPDFVTNAGGVLAGLAGMQGLTADDAFRLVRERIPPNVHLVLQAARDRGGSAHAAGVAIARARVLAA
jgi:glutamate dehydrogenase (NAD(P)+)